MCVCVCVSVCVCVCEWSVVCECENVCVCIYIVCTNSSWVVEVHTCASRAGHRVQYLLFEQVAICSLLVLDVACSS